VLTVDVGVSIGPIKTGRHGDVDRRRPSVDSRHRSVDRRPVVQSSVPLLYVIKAPPPLMLDNVSYTVLCKIFAHVAVPVRICSLLYFCQCCGVVDLRRVLNLDMLVVSHSLNAQRNIEHQLHAWL
jgi:hypothetical protein